MEQKKQKKKTQKKKKALEKARKKEKQIKTKKRGTTRKTTFQKAYSTPHFQIVTIKWFSRPRKKQKTLVTHSQDKNNENETIRSRSKVICSTNPKKAQRRPKKPRNKRKR